MNVKWLVEDFEPDNKIWELVAEIKRQGHECEFINYLSYAYGAKNPLGKKGNYPDEDCVIFQGSIQLASWLYAHKSWVPTVWFEKDKFKCSMYYSYLGKYLFNSDYEFTTVAEYHRRLDYFTNRHSVANCLFVRPDTGMKSFTGQVFEMERHRTDWMFFKQFVKPEDLLVVASPKKICAEWRFVIAEGKIIASSLYHLNGHRHHACGAPDEATKLCELVVAEAERELKPGPMYVVDVCKDSNDNYGLLELNCFSCAGLYACDKEPIVREASRIAWKQHQTYHKSLDI